MTTRFILDRSQPILACGSGGQVKRHRSIASIGGCAFLICLLSAIAAAEVARAASDYGERAGSLDDPEDPPNLLAGIRQRRTEKESLFPVSPLGWLHDATGQAKKQIYEASSLKLGLSLNHLFMGTSDALPDADRWGTATTTDFVGTWELLNKGTPEQGELFFGVQGRWDYGTTGPEDLAADSLGSLLGTANTFAKYVPTFLLRNLFWRQGSPSAGWAYRVGKITPDAILATSKHIASVLTFMPTASSGPFAIALPDSGLGAVGAWYINDRATLVGLVSDANGDRYDFGDIGAGDLFKALEFHYKIAPRTPKAGYSKLTVWHTDGTKNGLPANGSNGPEGWGFFAKLEQELSADGRSIGILRYGKSFNESAFYDQLVSAQYLLYDPPSPLPVGNDLFGVGLNWVDATSGVRGESDLELFYRFPVVPLVDMTLSYQLLLDPALDLGIDRASAFGLRIRTTF